MRGVKEGLVIAFLGALAVGIFSNGPLGGGVLAMVVAALLPWLRETRLGENRLTLGLGIAFGGTLVFYSLYWFASQLVGRGGGDWYSSLTVIALPAAFLNVIVMPVLYGPLQWVGQRV
ncbi:MAG: hypothetical protein HYU86_12735 [Chloroflexi bacterium]|nr:hypothetical protein [Chloroflexota bacterium]